MGTRAQTARGWAARLLGAIVLAAAIWLIVPVSDACAVAAADDASAVNATNKASVATIYRFGWSNGKYRSKTVGRVGRYDVTGDAVRDKVVVRVTPQEVTETGLASGYTIRVNGQIAHEATLSKTSFDQITVSVVTLKNNKPALFASAYCSDGTARQALLHYTVEGFVTVADNGLLGDGGVSNAHISQVLAAGNRVILQYDFVSSVTGVSRTSFAFERRKGRLTLVDATSKALRYVTTSTGEFTRQPLKAARAFVVYTGPALTRKAFSVAAGKQVSVLALRIAEGELLYKVKVGARKGWISGAEVAGQGTGLLLSGAYGKTPQSNALPTYSKTKALRPARLQRLSNHALFLVRNEVYARHGFAFENAELARYFGEKNWYKSKPGAQVKLGAVEQRNVQLVLSIERNRRSPYVS